MFRKYRKSKNLLRASTKAYFAKNLNNNRLAQMVTTAAKLDWQVTDSEIEALILESQLIKKFKPRFNIMLRDDKQYFYVEITNEEFPKIFITHRPSADIFADICVPARQVPKGTRQKTEDVKDKYNLGTGTLGPFTDGTALKTTLRWLRKVFPYCTCKQKHNLPCLNSHLGLCLGYCCERTKVSEVPKASRPGYQKKKEYKKNIKAITEILTGKKTNLTKKLEREMEALAKRGKLEEAIKLRNQLARLSRVFENAQINENWKLKIENSDEVNLLRQVQKEFKLPNLPHRIEAYDVSNIQGNFAVGVMIVFTDGQPDKNQYRKFKIGGTGPASALSSSGLAKGDPAMLSEMLTRRFKRSDWPQPNLILVDGGKAQLNVSRAIARQIPVIALTKDDHHRGSHIYSSQFNEPASLASLATPIKNLILNLDSEAHRFAINYYRSRHRKSFQK